MLMYWYVATKGVDLLVRPHATSNVSSIVTTMPNIAMAEADRRVRMLESASRKDANGAIRRSGTAQGSALDGSNAKPGLVPEAAPDAALTISPATAIRLSEFPPCPQRRLQAPPAPPTRSRAARRTPGPGAAGRPPRRRACCRRTQVPH